jgi:hypothetical protein
MDLDYLSERRADELRRAKRATCEESRKAHEELAKLYQSKIEQHSAPQSAARQKQPSGGNPDQSRYIGPATSRN